MPVSQPSLHRSAFDRVVFATAAALGVLVLAATL
jgi:hypothetical protein